jgi:hypothetical protein
MSATRKSAFGKARLHSPSPLPDSRLDGPTLDLRTPEIGVLPAAGVWLQGSAAASSDNNPEMQF